jgi:MFS family permease
MSPPAARFTLVSALSAVACAGAAIGLSFPLMSLNLDDWGVDPAGIGLFTLAAAISTVVATPFVPGLLARAPVRAVLAGALCVIAATFLLSNAIRDVWAWAVFRFAAGMAYSFLFVSAEAWVLEHTRPERRGFVLGLFASTFAGAMALGGVIISLVGHAGPLAFYAGAAIAASGLLAMALPGPGLTAPEGESARPSALWDRIRAAPIVFLAPLAMGAIETAKYNLIPIYARRVGLGDETAAQLITASGLGVLLLQPLIGALGDRLGPRLTLALCALAGAGLPLAVAAVGAAPLPALALVFAYSGIVTGLYTVGLIWMARFFSGGALAAGNAAFALCYGVGQLIGPAGAGAAFSVGGPWGFMAALAGMAGVYLAVLGVAGVRRGAQRRQPHPP